MANNVYTTDISTRIKEYRIAKKISQEKMAELLNITFSNYTKIENAYQNVTIKHLKSISKVLDISIDTLVFGDEDKPSGLRFDDFILFSKLFNEVGLENTRDNIEKVLALIKADKEQ